MYWSPVHPTYKAAQLADTSRPRNAGPLHGLSGFWIQAHCAAMLELALSQHEEAGDEGGFSLLMTPDSDDDTVSEQYQNKLRELMNTEDTVTSARLQREVVDLMVYMVAKEAE